MDSAPGMVQCWIYAASAWRSGWSAALQKEVWEGGLVDGKFGRSQEWALAARRANRILGEPQQS